MSTTISPACSGIGEADGLDNFPWLAESVDLNVVHDDLP